MNRLTAQPRQFRAVEERCAARSGVECRDVAEVTLRFVELLLAYADEFPLGNGAAFVRGGLLRAAQPSGRHTEAVQVEVHVLHVLGRNVELVIKQSHHRTLLHLRLSLAYLFGVTTVRCTHVRREAQLDGQVRVLCLITRQAELPYAALGDVVAAAAYPKLRVVRLRRKLFYLVAVESHHLSHADVPKRNAYRAEKLIRVDGFACLSVALVPVGDAVFGIDEAVRLAVREGKLLFVPAAFELAFCRHAVDALVVQHAAVVLEEGSVLSRNIDQHGTETVGSRPIYRRSVGVCTRLRPQGRLRAPGIAVARAAGVACIDRTETRLLRQHIVVEAVAVDEAARVGLDVLHPRSVGVEGKRRVDEHRAAACAQGIAVGHFEVLGSKAVILPVASGKEEEGKEQKALVHSALDCVLGPIRPMRLIRSISLICLLLSWVVRS